MYLDVADVAKLLNVSENQVYHWINQDHLPAIEVRGKYRFNRSDMLEWATVSKHTISLEAFREQIGLTDDVSLVTALMRGGVAYDLKATNKESALREIVDSLALPPQFDRESLFHLFMARERLGSTAIGDQIAIPHPRHPVILPTPGPSLTLCFLAEPIAYGAWDKSTVHTLFVAISPTIRVHLQILACLGRALQNERFRSVLLRRGTRDELLSALVDVEKTFAAAKPIGG